MILLFNTYQNFSFKVTTTKCCGPTNHFSCQSVR